ncbi:MAG: hypothetical protein GWN16_07200, partial [Calditrichae bacterium]|nr:hypothetical protein [Calditrichia bacterium]NIW93857.1 hypothetical protein [Phycisphaerae bacterium]
MKKILYKILVIGFSLLSAQLSAQTNSDCMMCHSDPDFTTERQGREVSLYVDINVFNKSVHQGFDCVVCHEDADVELPHPENLEDVNCGNCHSESQEKFNAGIHGIALQKGELYAPTCVECHGKHDILPPENPKSPTYKINIPYLCGKCHREGAPVARVYNITEHNIIENYTQSIHGEGL